MEVDYIKYGVGEAKLGSVNVQCDVAVQLEGSATRKSKSFDGNAWLEELATLIHDGLIARKHEIAHFKLSLSNLKGPGRGALAAFNVVSTGGENAVARRLQKSLTSGRLILNLRAEADPDKLVAVVFSALAAKCSEEKWGLNINKFNSRSFRPGQPVPTHRVEGPPS